MAKASEERLCRSLCLGFSRLKYIIQEMSELFVCLNYSREDMGQLMRAV